MKRSLLHLLLFLLLAACSPADPTLVRDAVDATLAAVPTQTPVVVVVTVMAEVAVTATSVASPTQPQANTPTNLPPTAPLPTSTLTPFPTPTPELLFSDDFSQNKVWNIGDLGPQRTAIENGQLVFTLNAPDRFGLIYNSSRRARDFFATVRGGNPLCATRDRYGLLFRVQDDTNYYQFEVDCDGRYRLARMIDGQLTALKDWTADSAIQVGGGVTNILGVRAVGDTLSVSVNDQSLITMTDDVYSEGGFGFYAGSGLTGPFTAFFDDLQVREVTP